MDYGLIGGLAEGIKQGTQSYQDARRQRLAEDQVLEDRKNRLAQQDKENQMRQATLDQGVLTEKNKNVRELGEKGFTPVYDESNSGLLKGTAPIPGFKKNDLDEEYKRAQINKLNADAKKDSSGAGLSEGEKALDKNFTKDYLDWNKSGRAVVEKNLQRLEDAKKSLAEDSSLTGGVRGLLPDAIRNVTNEKAITTRDDVRAAAQGALKATLGAQFTEREGERIMNQAYNEKLSPQANIAKIDAAIQELRKNKDALDSQSQFFEKSGSLKGWSSGQGLVAQKPSGLLKETSKTNAHPQDDAAVAWANANPKDPRSVKILEANGASNGIAR